MYPVKLYLKNFLSYGNQGTEIDFSGYQVLLLIGKNGAGKSSILDAILWALWGKTRSGGDNDIMHSGSSDMEVRLDFVVRDATYRVVRKRSKKGKGFVSVLELQSLTEPITVLTDATIVQTQTRIDALVGVDYELLVNSAFLRQGQAQEFTQKSPTKRKQLLTILLGLEQYAHYHEQAKKNLKQAELELNQIERDIQTGSQTLLQYDQEITLQKSSLNGQSKTDLELKIADTEQRLQALQLKAQLENNWKERFANASQKVLALQKKITDINTAKTTIQQHLSPLYESIGNAPEVIDQALWEKLEADFQQTELLYQKYQDLIYRIQTTQSQLAKLRTDTEKQLQTLEAKIVSITITDQQSKIKESIETIQSQLEQKQNEQITLAQTIAKLEQQMQSIIDQGNQINKRKETVTSMDGHCPLCEQTLDNTHKHTIIDKYTHEREQLLQVYQEHKQTLEQLLTNKSTTEATINQLQHELQKQQAALHDYEIKQTQLESLHQQLKTIEHTAQEQKITLEVTLETLNQEQIKLAFDQDHWETLKKKRSAYQQAQLQAHKYQETRLKVQELEQNQKFQASILIDTQTELAATEAEIHELETQKPENDNQYNAKLLQDELNNFKKQQQYLIQLEALIIQREKDKAALEQKLAAHQEQQKNTKKQCEALELLVEALGNKGIPQMLIEESIPRLEQYANEILSHLSDNTMSIKLSLMRPSKTDRDAQIETLDILIGDSVGTRAYELFSGGEAFRIDIALRLALTKLLTEHTAGSIDFLVIDEGFGSQDDSGNDLITHIIHQLQHYFHLILIITHVDQLKEAFPDRLVIKKGPQGSEVFYDDD